MRYRSPHAAEGGRAPLAPRGTKLGRTVMMTVVAGAIGVVPALMGITPAHAATSTDGNFTINNATVVEGGTLSFSYTYTGTGDSYTLSTTPVGTNQAVVTTDYTAPTTPLVLADGSTTAVTGTITVPTVNRPLYEGSRTFTLTADDGTPAEGTTATGTITDTSSAPTYTLSASPNPVNEANTSVSVTATLSTVSGVNTTVAVTTTDGSAKAGTNFQNTAITPITINAGQLTGTTTIGIVDDGMHDATSPMTFTVNGSGVNVASQYQNATVSINDAQPMPKLSLSGPATIAEGATATYTVTSTYASATPITVNWSVVDTTPASGHNTATPGSDFPYPSSGRTVTIPAGPGNTTGTITIPITQDNLNELSEDYAVAISDPTNATLNTTTKVVTTITSADLAPTVSVTPTQVTEGDSGARTETFTANLSAPSGRTVTVNWNTADGTALQGYDYVATSGTLTFPAGTTSKTFTVDILGDKMYEPGNETFSIQLSAPASENPDFSISVSAPATVTILDDDPQPTISVGDLSMKEGDVTQAILVPLKLSNPTSQTVVVSLAEVLLGTTSSSASITPGSNDYNLLTSSVSIPMGQLTGYGVILVNGDTMYEPDESANINWSASNVAAPLTGTAKLTLLNDDKAPNLEVNSIKGHEGDTVDVTGTVTGWSQDTTHLTVTFTGTSVNGKAGASADDFVNPGGSTVDIQPGTAPGVVLPIASVKLNTDDMDEPDETILASGVGTNNVGTVTDGVITILGTGGGTTPPPSGNGLSITAPAWITGAIAVPITGKADPGATVELWGAPWSTTSANPVKLGSTTAGNDGSYSFSRWIGTGYVFQTAVGDEQSDVVKVGIVQAPVFIAGSSVKGKLSLAVQGNPRAPKQVVIVQRATGGKWVNTWRGTTGSDNIWRATISEKSRSTWTLRAFVQGDMNVGINGGYSAAKKITIK